MNSLRLAEAIIRAAAPEGHEPLRSLEDLRGHMYGTHNLDVAYMLPQGVLLHLHDKEHAEPEWHGSPDASRSPGFTARRRAVAAYSDDWDRMLRSLSGSGFPDSQMRLDTGHNLWVFHQGDVEHRATQMPAGYNAHIWHPNMLQHHGNSNLSVHLGQDPDHVGPLLRRAFSHPEAMAHLMGQMQGDPGLGHTYLDMTQAR